jgi:sulfur carrier protein
MSSVAIEKQIEIVVNGNSRSVAATTTIEALLCELEIPLRGVAVEINGQIVPRMRHAAQALTAGDRIEIVSLVGGG